MTGPDGRRVPGDQDAAVPVVGGDVVVEWLVPWPQSSPQSLDEVGGRSVGPGLNGSKGLWFINWSILRSISAVGRGIENVVVTYILRA